MYPYPFRIWYDIEQRYISFNFDDILVKRDYMQKAYRYVLLDEGWSYDEIPITVYNTAPIEQFTGQYTGSGEPIYVDFPKN